MFRRFWWTVFAGVASLALVSVASSVFFFAVTGFNKPIASLNIALYAAGLALPAIIVLALWAQVIGTRLKFAAGAAAAIVAIGLAIWFLSVPPVEHVGDSVIIRHTSAWSIGKLLSIITSSIPILAIAALIFWAVLPRDIGGESRNRKSG